MNVKDGKDIIWLSLVPELLFSSLGDCTGGAELLALQDLLSPLSTNGWHYLLLRLVCSSVLCSCRHCGRD